VGTGQMIAIDVMLLYIVFGPVVLLGIYVLFDSIDPTGKTKKDVSPEKDPALWTNEEIDEKGFKGMGLDEGRNRI